MVGTSSPALKARSSLLDMDYLVKLLMLRLLALDLHLIVAMLWLLLKPHRIGLKHPADTPIEMGVVVATSNM
jgi:hypothetical protein